MQRQASQGRRHASRWRRQAVTRLLRVSGYLTIAFGTLLSTLALPTMLQSLRSNSHSVQQGVTSVTLSKESYVGSQKRGLSWKQEQPHRTKLALDSEDQDEMEEKLWAPPADRSFVPCVKPEPTYLDPGPSKGYLMVNTNGGLNQMRAGICDMVAIARLINATLVIPKLDQGSFWQDNSNFSDIFDVDYFIKSLANDVHVVKKLPKAMKREPKVMKAFRSWSNGRYYEEEIGRLWQNYKVIKAAKSDSRLANNGLPIEIQKLRCRVHYDALRFAPHIEALGKVLVKRMRSAGPFVSVHLRYEKDMLAFSGCTYGLTIEEAEELTTIRASTPHWRVKQINATEQRRKGFCPLTPKEVGVVLHALGYPETTRVYIAAGEIYGGRKHMAGFLSRFPHVMTKETIASAEEIAPFLNHSSQMAALDYIVSVESDVFVPSYSGNMARAVEGHRRFLGHRKTINPNRQAFNHNFCLIHGITRVLCYEVQYIMVFLHPTLLFVFFNPSRTIPMSMRKELVALFDLIDKGLLQENQELGELITAMHYNRQGAPQKRKGPLKGTKGRDRFRSEEAFYTNPTPDCLCQHPHHTEHVNYYQN